MRRLLLLPLALALGGSAATAALPKPLRGREIERIATQKRVVALTFDAGGDDRGAAPILGTLERQRVPATFFLTGVWARRYPRLARRIGRDGFAIGNHSLDHPVLLGLPTAAVTREIAAAGAIIRARTGRDPRPLFRFPYGARDSRTIRIANDLGYADIRWSVDTWGWMGRSAGQSSATVLRRVATHLQPGAIVLMHVGGSRDGSTLDAAALPSVLRAIRARGYRPVALDAYFRRPGT